MNRNMDKKRTFHNRFKSNCPVYYNREKWNSTNIVYAKLNINNMTDCIQNEPNREKKRQVSILVRPNPKNNYTHKNFIIQGEGDDNEMENFYI